jgi:N-acetylglutamate synthase-like GNAT family acetyltransferase
MIMNIHGQQVSFEEARKDQLPSILDFLSRAEIASGFIPNLANRSVSIRNRVYNDDLVWIVATLDANIIGCRGVFISVPNNENTFTTLAVDPRFQKIGVGCALFELSVYKAESLGHRTLRFDSWSGNDGISKLAYKFGFKIIQDAFSGKRPEGVRNLIYVREL